MGLEKILKLHHVKVSKVWFLSLSTSVEPYNNNNTEMQIYTVTVAYLIKPRLFPYAISFFC